MTPIIDASSFYRRVETDSSITYELYCHDYNTDKPGKFVGLLYTDKEENKKDPRLPKPRIDWKLNPHPDYGIAIWEFWKLEQLPELNHMRIHPLAGIRIVVDKALKLHPTMVAEDRLKLSEESIARLQNTLYK